MSRSRWGTTPRASIQRQCALRGQDAVVAACVALLRSEAADAELIYALGGPPARWAMDGGRPGPDYWLRVWASRGLLHVFTDSATSAVLDALDDPHWRVREMAAKVCGRHRLEDALPGLAELGDDPSSRVRRAAHAASVRIMQSR